MTRHQDCHGSNAMIVAQFGRGAGRRTGVFDAELSEATREMLLQDPDGLAQRGVMLKDGDRCTVVKISGEVGGVAAPLVLKRYNFKGAAHTAVHAFMRTRARWSWRNGRMLARSGLRTPRPVAMIEERPFRMFRGRSYLLTTHVNGRPLLELASDSTTGAEQLAHWAEQFAGIWRELGRLRIGHGDMKASNFLVDAEQRLWLIDLDGMRRYRLGAMLRRERRNDLARFMRNWQAAPAAAAAFGARIDTA